MNKMKNLKTAMLALTATFALASCDVNDNDTYYNNVYANALVTVKANEAGTCYLQLNNSTVMWPTNLTKNPYGDKEVRALVSCYRVNSNSTNVGTSEDETGNMPSEINVYVNWMDSIRTKDAVSCPAENVDALYGNDPVEIVNDWVTVAEDGYLTLRFRTLWGASGTVHYINLLTGVNPNDPYEVELRHDAKGDTNGHWGDALVAFKVPALASASGKGVKLTLKYKSFTGEKTVTFDYDQGLTSSESANLERGSYSLRVK